MNNYFVLVGNEIQLIQNGVDVINNDLFNLLELDIMVEVSVGGKIVNDIGVLNIICVNEVLEIGFDSYFIIEGFNLIVVLLNGVLVNDLDFELDLMVVILFVINVSGFGV